MKIYFAVLKHFLITNISSEKIFFFCVETRNQKQGVKIFKWGQKKYIFIILIYFKCPKLGVVNCFLEDRI